MRRAGIRSGPARCPSRGPGRSAPSRAPRILALWRAWAAWAGLRVGAGLADEERGEDERDRGEQLHQHVERRSRGVLERIPDRVTHDRGGVCRRLLADDLALVV